MNALPPLDRIYLTGDALTRGVTLTLPTARVLDLLPYGLTLGPQDLTPPGTHPVVLYFNDIFRGHLTVPSLLPSLTYHEQTVGIPFAYVTRGVPAGGVCGPFFFMPRLFLDSYLATAGGILYWGFPKELARFTITDRGCPRCPPDARSGERYAVSSARGEPLLSVEGHPLGDYQPLAAFPDFEPMRRVMCQPLISQVPAAVGPWFVASDYQRDWEAATVRPLRTVVHIDEAFVPGLPCGRFPAHGRAVGIDRCTLGSYELEAPWRLSLAYPYLEHWRPRCG